MARLQFSGPFRYRVSGFFTLMRITLQTFFRHRMGRAIASDWDWLMETGILFWRHQFTRAMNHPDMALTTGASRRRNRGRELFDAVLTLTDHEYDVAISHDEDGVWIMPDVTKTDTVLLYLHGGGYTFNGPVSERYASMLAHHTGARLYMPTYRLSPEHPHPAQAQDALAAWLYLRARFEAEQIMLIGDSAGGHMALMLLNELFKKELGQPALCIALCPWTDIGERGASLVENDRYDLVQGWMALRFGQWLDPQESYGREALSPIAKNYHGHAPIYMQAGGREVLRDMIIDFAELQSVYGADLLLDLWDDMPHNFQAYDGDKVSSTEALSRIAVAVQCHGKDGATLPVDARRTKICSGCFSQPRS